MDAKKAVILTAVGLTLFMVVFQTDQAIAAVNWLLGSLRDGAVAIMGFVRDLAGGG